MWLESALVYGGALMSWALALYVLSRGGRRLIPVLAGLAMLSLVIYLLGLAIALLSPDYRAWSGWLRWTWWGAVLAPGCWCLVTARLAADEGPAWLGAPARRFFPAMAAALLAAGGLFIVAGATTDLVHRWSLTAADSLPVPDAPWRVPPGPLYRAYQAYVLLCAVAALAGQAVLWRASPPSTPLRARFGWLAVTAVLFLLGGAHLSVPALQIGGSGLPGELLLVAGMVVMGWNLARYGALLQGEVVRGDLAAFGLRQLGIVAVYGVLLLLLAPREFGWLARTLPLLPLLMVTHLLASTRLPALDRLLYGPVAGASRGALQELAGRVVRQPDPVTALADVREHVDALVRSQESAGQSDAGPPPELRLLVEGALRHLNDAPELSQHPLLERLPAAVPAEGTPLERAARLRRVLEDAIDRLRPPGPRPQPGSGNGPGGWLHYVVLHEAYVEGRPNKQIMQRYYLGEGTFHRARRRAIDAITLDLHERAK